VRVEVVELRKKCGERDEGGATFEVFVPSLEREAETDFVVFEANVGFNREAADDEGGGGAAGAVPRVGC
jgi:hypothetical protein